MKKQSSYFATVKQDFLGIGPLTIGIPAGTNQKSKLLRQKGFPQGEKQKQTKQQEKQKHTDISLCNQSISPCFATMFVL